MACLYLKKIDLLNIYNKSNYFMPKLCINDYNFNDLDNCNNLTITELRIYAPNNINLLLDKLYKFTNLQILFLSHNKITEIKGLDKLINLQELDLSNNKLTEIKGLDKLINLQVLHLYNNKITEIKRLDKLVNLQVLDLYCNKIT